MSDSQPTRHALRDPALGPWAWLAGGVPLVCAVVFLGVLGGRLPVSHGDVLTPEDAERMRSYTGFIASPLTDRRIWFVGMTEIESQMGRAATPALLQSTNDARPRIRRFALEALGMVRDPRGLPAMVEGIEGDDGTVAESAAIALGDLGTPEVRDPLARALQHASAGVRISAAESLAMLALDDAHIRALMARADDPNQKVKEAAAFALQPYAADVQRLANTSASNGAIIPGTAAAAPSVEELHAQIATLQERVAELERALDERP